MLRTRSPSPSDGFCRRRFVPPPLAPPLLTPLSRNFIKFVRLAFKKPCLSTRLPVSRSCARASCKVLPSFKPYFSTPNSNSVRALLTYALCVDGRTPLSVHFSNAFSTSCGTVFPNRNSVVSFFTGLELLVSSKLQGALVVGVCESSSSSSPLEESGCVALSTFALDASVWLDGRIVLAP